MVEGRSLEILCVLDRMPMRGETLDPGRDMAGSKLYAAIVISRALYMWIGLAEQASRRSLRDKQR